MLDEGSYVGLEQIRLMQVTSDGTIQVFDVNVNLKVLEDNVIDVITTEDIKNTVHELAKGDQVSVQTEVENETGEFWFCGVDCKMIISKPCLFKMSDVLEIIPLDILRQSIITDLQIFSDIRNDVRNAISKTFCISSIQK